MCFHRNHLFHQVKPFSVVYRPRINDIDSAPHKIVCLANHRTNASKYQRSTPLLSLNFACGHQLIRYKAIVQNVQIHD
jgi:hypothetical protein